ncbi:MAG: ZIP family metal transporter [Planctomycetia bacterium]|nr:ZIP family metal transporter [Planctomycetia bacterium]
MCTMLLATTLPDATAFASLVVELVLIAAAAFIGGSSLAFLSLGHRPMQVLLSLTGGVLLGVGMLHLLPHAWMQLDRDIEKTMGWVLAGFFLMFLLERAFHGHAHHAADGGCNHGHDHDHHGHDVSHGHQHTAAPAGRSFAWCGAFAGLALHSLADGAALAASVGSDAAHGVGLLAGSATFLAILLHKPFDAGIIATLMIDAGASPRTRLVVNALYAAVVPIGAFGFLTSLTLFGGRQDAVLGIAMAMAAGAFLCIAAADLLPEVQFHSHDRVLLTTALAMGLAIAWGITALERSSHAHGAHAQRGAVPAAAPAQDR